LYTYTACIVFLVTILIITSLLIQLLNLGGYCPLESDDGYRHPPQGGKAFPFKRGHATFFDKKSIKLLKLFIILNILIDLVFSIKNEHTKANDNQIVFQFQCNTLYENLGMVVALTRKAKKLKYNFLHYVP
jgi:hypothetical protein